jgi:hypothetical protein
MSLLGFSIRPQADIDTNMYYGSQMVVMVMADGCARRVSGSGQVAQH